MFDEPHPSLTRILPDPSLQFDDVRKFVESRGDIEILKVEHSATGQLVALLLRDPKTHVHEMSVIPLHKGATGFHASLHRRIWDDIRGAFKFAPVSEWDDGFWQLFKQQTS